MSYPYLYGKTPLSNPSRVYGVPGGSLNSAGFDSGATNAGIDGERRVAAVLDDFVKRTPGAYVFHSVKLPGHYGDIDHVLLTGDTVIVIDSKNWRSDGSYNVMSDGETILRNGERFPGGTVKVTRYVRELNLYTQMQTIGLLVAANSRSKVASSPDATWDILNIEGLKAFLRDHTRHTAMREYTPDELVFLSSRVVNPKFTGDWKPYVESERLVSRRPTHGGYKPSPGNYRAPRRPATRPPHALVLIVTFAAFVVIPMMSHVMFQPWQFFAVGASFVAYGIYLAYKQMTGKKAFLVLGAVSIGIGIVLTWLTYLLTMWSLRP